MLEAGVTNMKLLVILLVNLAIPFAKSLSSWQGPCPRNETLSACLAKKMLYNMKSVLDHEPIGLGRLQKHIAIKGLHMDPVFTDLKAYGTSKLALSEFKFNLNDKSKYTSEILLQFPVLNITANYNMVARTKHGVSVPRSTTKGKLKGTFLNCHVQFTCDATVYKKYDREFLKLKSFQISIKIAGLKLTLKQSDRSWQGRQIVKYAYSHPMGFIRNIKLMKNVLIFFKKHAQHYLDKTPLDTIIA